MDVTADAQVSGTGQLSRRHFLRLAIGAAGLAATGSLLSTVGVAARTGATARGLVAPAAVAAGATLTFLANDSDYSNDPAQNWDYGGGSTILAHAYEGLFKFVGADGAKVVPNLASEVPTLDNGGITPDGLTYTVKLKPNAKFHDGSPVNADAVKFSYDRTRKLHLGVDFLTEQIDTSEVVDETTIKFHLKQPFSSFLLSISALWGNSIVSPKTVNANSKDEKDFGQAYLAFHDAGSGGYLLDSYNPDQKTATLVKDPNWWQGWGGKGNVDKVIIQWVTEPATVRQMLEKGDAQIVAGLTAEDFQALSGTAGIRTAEYAATLESWIPLNVHKQPLDNIKVRQALAYSFNYDQAINGILGGHGVKLDSVAAKPYIGYSPAKNPYTFDLDKAKSLLAESGVGPFDLDMVDIQVFPSSGLFLELWQSDLKKIGITLNIKQMDANTYQAKQTTGNPDDGFPGVLSNIGGDYPDAYELVALCYAKRSKPPALCCNISYYENDQMEPLIANIEKALDPIQRQAALQASYDFAFEDEPVIWIHNFKQLIGLRDSVQNWEYNFMYGWNYAPFEQISL